jgi:hypothetical protein
MKIPFEDGMIVDTDKLTDKDAAVHEAIHNLSKVCRKYGVTAFTRVILNHKKYVGMNTITKDKTRVQADMDFLMEAIAKFCHDVSGGQIEVMIQTSPDEQAPPPPESGN